MDKISNLLQNNFILNSNNSCMLILLIFYPKFSKNQGYKKEKVHF